MMTRLALTLFIAGFASAATAQDIGGSYSVAGTNINGTTYEGTAEIAWNSDVTCTIDWSTGTTTSTGICMRDGNAFVAGYVLQDKVGLVIYLVGEDGTLTGSWTVSGQDGVGTEVLTPM